MKIKFDGHPITLSQFGAKPREVFRIKSIKATNAGKYLGPSVRLSLSGREYLSVPIGVVRIGLTIGCDIIIVDANDTIRITPGWPDSTLPTPSWPDMYPHATMFYLEFEKMTPKEVKKAHELYHKHIDVR